MKMDPELMNAQADYLIEKFAEHNPKQTETVLSELEKLIYEEADPVPLIQYLFENYKSDTIVNELKRAIISEKDYLYRKAQLLRIQYVALKLKRKQKEKILKTSFKY